MKKRTYIPLVSLLLIVFVLQGISLFREAQQEGTLLIIFGTLFVVGLFIFLYAYYFHRKLRRKEPLLAQLRKEKPVAYFCTLPLAGNVNLVSSDEKDITIWNIEDDRLVPAVTLSRDEVTCEKGRVQVAAARSVDGVVISALNEPESKIALNLCRDKLSLMFPSLKEPELSAAIARLAAGK